LKKVEDDPRYDRKKAEYLLKSFVELHPHAIGEKVRICVEHFAARVQSEIGGKAKAIIVTRSRLHAVRYRLAVDKYLAERGYPFKALVAFSRTVPDGGHPYTEANMNGSPDAQTAKAFERSEYRFLIVANKFQTGFDQPLLHTMYVDKKLGGVNAVQTLSRLNRTHPEKNSMMVLEFANEADEIKAAFEPYYETTLLSEATDPNLLYEVQTRLAAFPVYTEADIGSFAKVYFDPKSTLDRLYSALSPVVERFGALAQEEKEDFRGQLTDYVRLYAFLSQVLTFADADLEKLYVFARHLRRLLPADRAELPREVQQNIDMESYRIRQTGSGRIGLDRKAGMLDPVGTKGAHGIAPEEMETLSRIIAELNERFGLNLGPEHKVTLGQMMERLDDDAALDAAARANTRENVRLTFDQKVEHVIQEIVDSNFDLYKRITDEVGQRAAPLHLGQNQTLQFLFGGLRFALLGLRFFQGTGGQHRFEVLRAFARLRGMRLVDDHRKALARQLADPPRDDREFLQGREMIVFPASSASFNWREVVSMFSTTPRVCSNWRIAACSCRSRTRRSVTTTIESKTRRSDASCRVASRCASQAIVKLLPLPAECSIR
jgi:type I restriction enzyme R subunit